MEFPLRRRDQAVGHEFGGRQSTARALEVPLVNCRWHQRHAGAVDDRLGGCEERRDDVDHDDRDAVE
jgi:hypothetical protein